MLCIPATSVPSERVFSTVGDILSAQQACLKAKHVDMIVFPKKTHEIKKKTKHLEVNQVI